MFKSKCSISKRAQCALIRVAKQSQPQCETEFRLACEQGDLRQMKHFLRRINAGTDPELSSSDDEEKDSKFSCQCYVEDGMDTIHSPENCLDSFLQELGLMQRNTVSEIIEEAFFRECKRGNLANVHWLSTVQDPDMDNGFYFACSHGHLTVASWLWDHGVSKTMLWENNFAVMSESRKHKDVRAWLDQMYKKHFGKNV